MVFFFSTGGRVRRTHVLALTYNAAITIAIRLRYDYDVSCRSRAPASIRRDSTRAKMNMSVFRRRSRIAVESNAYRSFDHFRRSRMRRGIVVS